MNVFLTFDIEVWCNGWNDLDRNFPASFERYVYGRSPAGSYALPQTLAILQRHGLKGVFFVEPLFAARFGQQYLKTVVDLIRDAGQEVQLHLHPEWTNEISPPLIEDCAQKRQHLIHYTADEQTALIRHGKAMLEAAGSGAIMAFRAGSFAANGDTFDALRRNGIELDSSLNSCYAVSGPDLRQDRNFNAPFICAGVSTYPVTVLRDGFGKARPVHLSACSFSEIRDGLLDASKLGVKDFVLVSHNFELLKVDSSRPDWIVVKRFERLCAFLQAHADRFQVRGFGADMRLSSAEHRSAPAMPQAHWASTSRRYLEQLQRRLS